MCMLYVKRKKHTIYGSEIEIKVEEIKKRAHWATAGNDVNKGSVAVDLMGKRLGGYY